MSKFKSLIINKIVSSSIRTGILFRRNLTPCVFSTPYRTMSVTAASKTRPNVFVTQNNVPQTSLDILKTHCDVNVWQSDGAIPRNELLKAVAGADGLFCIISNKINGELLDAAGPQLKVVSTMSVGYEHIDMGECKQRGVAVGYTPDVLTDTVAELTMSLLLATSRRVKEGMKTITSGEWPSTWKPVWMCGKDLQGSTVGIVGLGRIGAAVAARLRPFNIQRLLYTSRNASPFAADVGAKYVKLTDLLEESDFVIACCAFNADTKEMFNKDVFKLMRKNAVFVNVTRGGVVNQEDLYDALVTGEIWAAGLDVTTPEPLPSDHPLLGLNNCTIFPHLGSATMATRLKMADLAAQNIVAALTGEPMPSPLYSPAQTLQSGANVG